MSAVPTISEDDDLPEHLYHYTTVAGLHGILESNSLHATHAAYLNDSQELLYGMQLALDELQEWVRNSPEDAKAGWDPALPTWMISAAIKLFAFGLAAEVHKKTRSLRQTFGPFVTCLSKSRDQLSQWRGYGRGGGYAIKFDAHALRQSVQRDRQRFVEGLAAGTAEHGVPLGAARFIKMDYEPENQVPIVRTHLISFINEMAGRSAKTPEANRAELLEPLIRSILALAMRLKNPGFKEEGEYRIATFFVGEFFSPSDIGLVPRVALTFDPSCVKEVLIGPGLHMDTRESSVRYYLDSRIDPQGTPGQSKYRGVEVSKSNTPYRGD